MMRTPQSKGKRVRNSSEDSEEPEVDETIGWALRRVPKKVADKIAEKTELTGDDTVPTLLEFALEVLEDAEKAETEVETLKEQVATLQGQVAPANRQSIQMSLDLAIAKRMIRERDEEIAFLAYGDEEEGDDEEEEVTEEERNIKALCEAIRRESKAGRTWKRRYELLKAKVGEEVEEEDVHVEEAGHVDDLDMDDEELIFEKTRELKEWHLDAFVHGLCTGDIRSTCQPKGLEPEATKEGNVNNIHTTVLFDDFVDYFHYEIRKKDWDAAFQMFVAGLKSRNGELWVIEPIKSSCKGGCCKKSGGGKKGFAVLSTMN